MRILFALLATILVNLLGWNGGALAADTEAKVPAENKIYDFRLTDFDKVLGDPKASVLIIVYSSLTCPHCATFEEKIFPELQERYIRTGKIRYVHRDYPMDRPGLYGATLSLCKGGEHYYAFQKILFSKQELWAFKKNYQEVLTNIGKLGGLSAEAFDACLQDKMLQDRLATAAVEASKQYDVNAVPALFVNGKNIPAFEKDALFAAIEGALEGKTESKAVVEQTTKQ
jgi:protein-disulfide isomerase